MYKYSSPTIPQSITIHRSANVHIERVDAEDGTKLVKKTLLDIQGLASFYNEFKILNQISPTCPSARGAIRKGREDGKLVMFLEWAKGCSLAEWLEGNPLPDSFARDKDELMTRVSIAAQTACALYQVHAQGVVHNSLLAENFIVDMTIDSSCGVKMIDFSKAKESRGTEKVMGDFRALALLFHKLFIGSDDVDRNVPDLIVQVIANLLQVTAKPYAYSSALDVKYDLEQMLDLPEIFLFDRGEREASGNLKFQTGKIYGRNKECASLLDAFHRIYSFGGSPELILVSGDTGTGKQTILKSLRDDVKATGGHYISGRCDPLHRAQPYTAMMNALEELCGSILERNKGTINEMRVAIQAAVGDQGKLLTNFVAKLKEIIGEQPEVEDANGFERNRQLLFLFKKVVRSITTTLRDPIVMVLYDLQWADSDTLFLMKKLVTDWFTSSLIVVGVYRDNEVSDTDALLLTIQEIEKSKTQITSINVGNLAKMEMNRFIADQLGMLQRFVTPLTDTVYETTGGNIFFATQLLPALVDKQLLFFSPELECWDWDIDRIKSTVSGDAVQLLASKISKHSTGMQEILPVAAAIGSSFDESFLCLLIGNQNGSQSDIFSSAHNILAETSYYTKSEVRAFLHEAVREGHITQHSMGRYKFVHDSIQKAAYSILNPNDATYLHLKIGSISLQHIPTNTNSDRSFFFAVDHLNMGSSLLSQEEAKLDVVKFNLQAGQHAFKACSYTSAIEYLNIGVDFLITGHWTDEYETSLEIFTCLVESLYSGGQLDRMEGLVKEIFSEARCFIDKQRAHTCYIKYLIGKGRLKEAIEVGFEGLAQVGEVFPKTVKRRMVIMDLIKTKYMLSWRSDKDLTSLPPMKNENKIAAMKILTHMASMIFQLQPQYVPLVACRMIRLSLTFGSCAETASAFVGYGMVLGTGLGQYRRGFRFGQLGLKLVETLQTSEWLPQVYFLVYTSINHWVMHMDKSIEPLKYAYRVGIEVGYMEYAMYCAAGISVLCYLTGKPLVDVEHDMWIYTQQMNAFGLGTASSSLTPFYQSVLNLMGRSENPMLLNGQAMNEEEHMQSVNEISNVFAANSFNINSLWLAYLFGDYTRAGTFVELTNDLALTGSLPEIFANVFYCGLTSFALAKMNNNAKKWKRIGMSSIKKMTKWSRFSHSNSSHKILLLKAEKSVLGRHHDKTERYFNESIQEAKKNGFLNEEALATERFALFFLDRNNTSMAYKQFVQAVALYERWGAKAKVDHINEQIKGLELE